MHHELSPQMRNESKWDEVRLADPRREKSVRSWPTRGFRFARAGDVRFGSLADILNVVLMMAMEERVARIVGHKVDFRGGVARHTDRILHNP
jgi:hypothetical protein